jgi:cyanophycinase-like exopeptidase
MPGPLALVGSGEYLPVLERVERLLLEGRPARFVQLATAAAPEGPASLARWHELGRASAERLGVQQVVVPVVDRISADDEELAGLVAGAGLVYLSGGSPTFLAATLRGTAVWRAIEAAWGGGAALAGCSAGAMAMSSHVPDLRHPLRAAEPGLGVVRHLRVLPHFDRFAARVPDVLLTRLVETPPGVTVLGIDEDTALVGGPYEWEVMGRQSVWVLGADGRTEHPTGSRLSTAPPAAGDL